MTDYQLENWATYFRDCQDLWVEHYDEIAVTKDRMAMKPNVPVYEGLESMGKLQIVTARDQGRMVGYVVTIIQPHMHYADVLSGYEDAYFLSKTHRKGLTGVKLITEAVRHMRSIGVQKVFFMTKVTLNMGRIFERLGFTNSDLVYSKWIGD